MTVDVATAVDTSHELLSQVAALGEVNRRPDQTRLLGNGLLVDVDSPAGLTRGDPESLVLSGIALLQIGTVSHDQSPLDPGPGDVDLETAVDPGPGARLDSDLSNHDPRRLLGLLDLDVDPDPVPTKRRRQILATPSVGDQPYLLIATEHPEDVIEFSLRGEKKRTSHPAGLHRSYLLTEQVVEKPNGVGAPKPDQVGCLGGKP